MATLVLAGYPAFASVDVSGAFSLSEWLQDDWAILFSHPDDFVSCELEWDRWVSVARSAFAASRARPLALARPGRPLDCGWISRLSGDGRALLLNAGWRLQEDIERMSDRFVMIVDASLRRRRTFAYGAADRLPSPLDFLGWVRALRETRVPRDLPADSRPGYLAVRPRRYGAEQFRGQSAA